MCKIELSSVRGVCIINNYEGQEAYPSGLSRNQVYVKYRRKAKLTCRICKKLVRLGGNTATDEHGKPVHEHCQVKRIIGTQRYKELSQQPRTM
jgi:hypothetical protein